MLNQVLFSGDNKRECLLTVLKWAKLEGYDVQVDPEYQDNTGLEIEADYALDWLNAHVPDYLYNLEPGPYDWFFTRLAIERSVVECD